MLRQKTPGTFAVVAAVAVTAALTAFGCGTEKGAALKAQTVEVQQNPAPPVIATDTSTKTATAVAKDPGSPSPPADPGKDASYDFVQLVADSTEPSILLRTTPSATDDASDPFDLYGTFYRDGKWVAPVKVADKDALLRAMTYFSVTSDGAHVTGVVAEKSATGTIAPKYSYISFDAATAAASKSLIATLAAGATPTRPKFWKGTDLSIATLDNSTVSLYQQGSAGGWSPIIGGAATEVVAAVDTKGSALAMQITKGSDSTKPDILRARFIDSATRAYKLSTTLSVSADSHLTHRTDPAGASDGSTFAVAWCEDVGLVTTKYIRQNADGLWGNVKMVETIDRGATVASAGNLASLCSGQPHVLALGAGHFLVLWQDGYYKTTTDVGTRLRICDISASAACTTLTNIATPNFPSDAAKQDLQFLPLNTGSDALLAWRQDTAGAIHYRYQHLADAWASRYEEQATTDLIQIEAAAGKFWMAPVPAAPPYSVAAFDFGADKAVTD